MYVIKRDGSKQEYDLQKIINAVYAAVADVGKKPTIATQEVINKIHERVKNLGHMPEVEEIQDICEDCLMKCDSEVAKQFIRYRHEHKQKRSEADLLNRVRAIIGGTSEVAKQENSNKNPTLLATQRDYMAGELSKEIVRNYILPKRIMEAHDKGAIHIHELIVA